MVQPAPAFRPFSAPQVTVRPGEIVIEHHEMFAVGAEDLCLRFLNRALHVPDVAAVEVDRLGRATLFLNPGATNVAATVRLVATSLRNPEPWIEGPATGRFHFPVGERFVAARRSDWAAAGSPEVCLEPPAPERGRIVRGVYGVLAVGSLGMAWVGLLTPGIPTVPVVLLSSYCAVRSSPALHARLKRSRVFGPMLTDWEQHRVISRRTKRIAIVSALVVTAFTLVLVAGDPVLMPLGLLFGLLGLTVLLLLPTVDRGPQAPA